MNDEDFDGSALRELLTPAVADRGRTSAPTDAIVAAGRRRVIGRRTAVASGALAIVAAVPVAATAIAAGPDSARTPAVSSAVGTTHSPAPTHSEAPAQPKGGIAPKPTGQHSTNAGLPSVPTTIASGTVEGRTWSVSALTVGGNNALTAGQKCLGLVLTVDGRVSTGGGAPAMPYCLPVKNPAQYLWGFQDTLKYYYENGAGTLQMGMVKSDVAKIVAHVDGLAPVTVGTVPAPGFAEQAFYFIPIAKDQGFRVILDEYDAQGVKIGTYDNSVPNPGKQ